MAIAAAFAAVAASGVALATSGCSWILGVSGDVVDTSAEDGGGDGEAGPPVDVDAADAAPE